MDESKIQNFNHLKIHSQYSICEGAVKIDDLRDFLKDKKIKSLGLCDTSNLCGALEFAEKISKVGTQPIIGTQINIVSDNIIGKITLYATSEQGYRNLTKLSSLSYLKDKNSNDPYCTIDDLKTSVANTEAQLAAKQASNKSNRDIALGASYVGFFASLELFRNTANIMPISAVIASLAAGVAMQITTISENDILVKQSYNRVHNLIKYIWGKVRKTYFL